MIRTLFVEEESSLSEARAGSIYHPAAPSHSIFETIETMNTHFLSNRSLTLVLVTLLGAIYRIECFQPTTTQGFQTRFSTELAAESSTASIATLTDATTWTMRMSLENLPTEKGKKTGGIYVVQAKFIEEEGYEPPQGLLQQCFPEDAASEEAETGTEEKSSAMSQMTVSTGRWTLSEDPDDRKDGLWIWGLFKEPLYPFLLLQFDVEKIPLPGEEQDAIKPFRLFAKINHKREENGEVTLSSVTDVTIREKETFKADPFGAAKVDLYEDVVVGKLQLQPQ